MIKKLDSEQTCELDYLARLLRAEMVHTCNESKCFAYDALSAALAYKSARETVITSQNKLKTVEVFEIYKASLEAYRSEEETPNEVSK